jgi:hypothetical protein
LRPDAPLSRRRGFEAAQLEERGQEEEAAAQREAEQLRRRRDLALSRLTARSAASGFSATDPTALNLGEDIARYGTYQENLATFGGRSRRAGLEAQADAARFSGDAARQASYWRAGGTILTGVGSLASKYNPPSESRPDYLYDTEGGWRNRVRFAPASDYYPGVGSRGYR